MSTADTLDISVVIPAYNRARFIPRALASVAAQTKQPREVIVVDDGSSDDTVAVARAWGATVLTTPTNGGSGPARNLGIESAVGQWIAFLDSDDAWSADHLETLTAQTTGQVLVGSAGRSDTGRLIGNPTRRPITLTPRAVLGLSELVATSAVLARRDALIAAGLFRPLRRAQDLDMWIRLLSKGPGVAIPQTTFTYFTHDEQAILDTELMRDCFAEIVSLCAEEEWFEPGVDTDRAFARVRWDDARLKQREEGLIAGLGVGAWFLGRPHTWGSLVQLLRLRRLRRRANDVGRAEATAGHR